MLGVVFGAFNVQNPMSYIPLAINGLHVGTIGLLIVWGLTLWGISGTASKAIRGAKLQNPLVASVVGAGLGAFAYYVHWCVLAMLAAKEPVLLPHTVYFFMSALVDNDWMSMGLLETPSTNWFFWGIEGLAYVVIGARAAKKAAAIPFCVDCAEWADTAGGSIDLPLTLEGEALATKIQAGQFEQALEELPELDDEGDVVGDAGSLYRFSMQGCHACKQKAFVSVSGLCYTFDDEGNPTEVLTAHAEHLDTPAHELKHLNEAVNRALKVEDPSARLFSIDASA
ncbi:MAG: hypothetical protein GY822_07360 [Deltaproteobacteria bacterium]|nr:hypothetical protein [Deltaproteobacteria bacterium]